MNLSIMEKISILFQYIFSSFLSIEMLLLSLLLFFILVINIKKKNHIIQMIAIGIYIGFILGILISYATYVKTCINSFVKAIMNYIYFPSTVVYFFIIVFVTIMMLYTLFTKKLNHFKKIVNYFFFSVLYFFFMSFVALAAYDSVDLVDTPVLYQNDVILALVQLSNFILLFWILYTGFYWFYRFLKRRFD